MLSIVITLFVAYFLLFIISLFTEDNSLVDTFWGIGFMIIAVLSYLPSPHFSSQIIITILVWLWWIRIVSHIGIRKIKDSREDARYAKWRREWWDGWYFYVRSFVQVYLLQMVLMFLIAVPILITNFSLNGSEFTLYIYIGSILALSGIVIEMIADIQLTRFIKIKKPWEIFTKWLYTYSRHPNYFGESIFWLGVSIISLPYSVFGIIWWITITYLLVFVSGIPLQEERYAGRKGWEEYKNKTSAFIPWFPKK